MNQVKRDDKIMSSIYIKLKMEVRKMSGFSIHRIEEIDKPSIHID